MGDSKQKLAELAVDGGMSNSDLCMQTQANIIGIPVDRPAMRETTALGAAIAAGFAVEVWKEFSELKAINQKDRKVFHPDISPEESDKMFKKWSRVRHLFIHSPSVQREELLLTIIVRAGCRDVQ